MIPAVIAIACLAGHWLVEFGYTIASTLRSLRYNLSLELLMMKIFLCSLPWIVPVLWFTIAKRSLTIYRKYHQVMCQNVDVGVALRVFVGRLAFFGSLLFTVLILSCDLWIHSQAPKAIKGQLNAQQTLNQNLEIMSHIGKGNELATAGRHQEAERAYQRAQQLRDNFDAQDASDPNVQKPDAFDKSFVDTFRCVNLLSLAHDSVLDGQYAKAEQALRQVVELSAKSTARFPDRVGLRHMHASSLNGLAWLLATCPGPGMRKPTESVALAERAVKLVPRDGNFWNTLGIARYCAARWEKAITALRQSNDLRDGGTPQDWLFLAMAHWQLGHKEQAHQWYARAVEWMEKNKPQDDELRRFRDEATNLLGLPVPPRPGGLGSRN